MTPPNLMGLLHREIRCSSPL